MPPADGVHGGEIGAPREHRHPREQPLLGGHEEPVGPVDRGGKALVAGLCGARAAGEQAAVVEPRGDLGDAHRPRARGGQLDAERQAVHPTADLGDRGPVGVDVRPGGPRAQHEQRRGVRERQRRHRPHLLAVDAERLPARGEHDDAGALRDEALRQPRGGVQDVLAVVEHEQQPAADEVLDDRLLDRRAVPLLHAQRDGDRVRDGAAVEERRQLGEPRAVGEPVALTARHLDREPGLPDSPDADERHQRGRPQPGRDRADRRVPPDERGAPARQVGEPGAVGGHERRVLLQHPTVQRAGDIGRLDAQLIDEAAAQRLVDGQCVGLPPVRVEGVHEQRGQGLPVRVALDHRRQLGDDRPPPAQREQRRRPFLDGGEAQVGQPRELPVHVDLGGVELVERLTAPQAERGVEQVGRRPVLACRGALAGQPGEAAELGGVELAVGDVERVARRPPPQPPRDHRAQPGDVGPQHSDGVPRRVRPPHRGDEAVGRHHRAPGEQQRGEHGARLRATDRDRFPAVDDLERTQDAELHAVSAIGMQAEPSTVVRNIQGGQMLATRRRDIARIAYGFMASKALFAALEIGLFALLADGPRTGADLVRATGVAAHRLTTLLRALVALGLLIADDEGFRNAPAAQRHLVRDTPGDVGEYYRLQVGRQIYPALHHLDAGIAGTGVAFAGFDELMGRPDDAATFTVGQHCASLEVARRLADRLPLGQARTLLDVGAGSGAFAIAFCERHPGLRATLLDFPQTLAVARTYRDAAGLAERIALVPGDVTRADWPGAQDVVLMSYLLSALTADEAAAALAAAHRSLRPGGLLVVHDFMLDDDGAGPAATALWFLQYLAWRPDAWSFTGAELGALLARAGFAPTPAAEVVPETTKVVLARRGEVG